MTPQPPPPPQSKAIAAFLRGVEQRARLLAQTQCGNLAAAQRALAATQQVFVSEAEQWPIPQWPTQYWRLLLSVPAMGQATVAAAHSPLPGIAAQPPATRAAVLLHLVACLEEADAAAALGIDIPTYQQRIRDALPHDRQGQPDLAIWRQWREAAGVALEAPEPPAAASTAPAPSPPAAAAPSRAPTAPPPQPPHRHLLRWLWLGVLVGVLALVATFFLHPRGRVLWSEWHNRVRVEALPAAAAPKARFNPTDPANDPDRALLAAPQDLALARDLPLLAWLAAQPEHMPAAAATATTPPAMPTPVPPLPAPLPAYPPQRAWLRAAYAEWQALPEPERSVLRTTAAQLYALPEAQQQTLRQRYAQQSYDAHRGWHLGPQLGRHWPRIAALFAYIDAGERDALLQLLRNTGPEEMETLARLAQITPPEARASLRKELLAVPASQRSAWLQARLNR